MRKARRLEPTFKSAKAESRAASPRRGYRDFFAAAGATFVALIISINVLFLQAGSHPAPIFANQPPPQPAAPVARSATLNTGAIALPRPRPDTEPKVEPAPRGRVEVVADIQRALTRHGLYEGNADGLYGSKTESAIRDFERRTGLKMGDEPNEAWPRVIAQAKVAALEVPKPPAPIPNIPAVPVASRQPPTDPTAEPPSAGRVTTVQVTAVQQVLSEYGYGQIEPTGTVNRETQAAIEQFERYRKLPVTGQISPRLMKELAALSGRSID